MTEIMKCGCAANGMMKSRGGVKFDPPLPCCLIHDCCEPAAKQPALDGRTAKCTYFGRTKPNRRYANDECNYGCHGNAKCSCGSVPSSTKLAFFKYRPDAEQDEFYCGCFGWD